MKMITICIIYLYSISNKIIWGILYSAYQAFDAFQSNYIETEGHTKCSIHKCTMLQQEHTSYRHKRRKFILAKSILIKGTVNDIIQCTDTIEIKKLERNFITFKFFAIQHGWLFLQQLTFWELDHLYYTSSNIRYAHRSPVWFQSDLFLWPGLYLRRDSIRSFTVILRQTKSQEKEGMTHRYRRDERGNTDIYTC